MTEQATHPSVEALAAFATGQLPPAEAVAVESHVGDCAPCCDTLLGLSADDTFANLLKESGEAGNSLTLGLPGEQDLGDDELSESELSDPDVATALATQARYEVIERIAGGGMGEVFRAKHRVMDREVALKVIKKDLMQRDEVVERFHREVKTAAQLSHPNIVTAYDADEADGVHFLVMEYVDGINLADLLRLHGPITIADACDYIRQAAAGLQHAHEQGMVHRDIKPHNLMLTSDGTVKILDFGLASLSAKLILATETELSARADLTAAGSIMGTPDYIAPEQATDARTSDIRSDIYSLGATLHYLLAGQPPFPTGSIAERIQGHLARTPTSLSNLREDVPPELSELVSRMMAKAPEQRFQTPNEVANALSQFLAKQSSPDASAGRSRRPPIKRIALACAALAAVLAGIFYVQTNQGTLKIETPDKDVQVTISRATDSTGSDYTKVRVVDTKTGSNIVRLPSGDYKVSLSETGNEYELSKKGFTLRRGEDVVVQVTHQPAPKLAQEAPPLVPITIPPRVQRQLQMDGARLSVDKVSELEAKIEDAPDDVESRLLLLGYYSRHSILSSELREPQAKLTTWLIQSYPEAAANSHNRLLGSTNPVGYVHAKKLWLTQLERYPQNTKVLGNAAKFFLLNDKELCEQLFIQAKTIEPENAEWPTQLGNLYQLGRSRGSTVKRRESAAKALAEFELASLLNQDSAASSSMLTSKAKAALLAGVKEKAKTYAQELLVAGEKTNDWNSGNAVHHGNIILGTLALQAGDVEAAGNHLLAAGKTKGSPQLNSFGPDMDLAQLLLERGEKDKVMQYLELCGEFWTKPQLKNWIATIKGGGTPSFGTSALNDLVERLTKPADKE